MGDFFKDLKAGKTAESEVIRRLARKFDVEEEDIKDSNQSAEYDLEVEGIKFEVKTDLQTNFTGNVAIEISKGCNDLSGTSISKADYYIYEIDGEYYVLTLNTIKIMAMNLSHKTTNGGDRFDANLALVRFEVFKEYASPLSEVSEKTLRRYARDKRLKIIKL